MYTNLYQKHTAYQYQRGFRARLQSRWQRPVTATLYLYATDDKNFYNQTHCLPIASCRRKRFFLPYINRKLVGLTCPLFLNTRFWQAHPNAASRSFSEQMFFK